MKSCGMPGKILVVAIGVVLGWGELGMGSSVVVGMMREQGGFFSWREAGFVI